MEFESFENITFSDITLKDDFDIGKSLEIVKAFTSNWNSIQETSTIKTKKKINVNVNSQSAINLSICKDIEEKVNNVTKSNLKYWGLPPEIISKYKSKGIEHMFEWQVECLSNSKVLIDYGNLIYSAPTSAGKTLVAEMLTIKTVLERRMKVIIILPFVSVVREKMFYFQNIFNESGIRVEGFMGSHSPPGGIESIHIAICTIEKANNLVNSMLESGAIENLGAVVVDELHLIGDPHRGYILELLLTKLLYITKKLNYKIQIIGMSATLPNLDTLSNWLEADLYKTNFRPIPLQEYCMLSNVIYDSNLKQIRELNPSDDIINDKEFIIQLCLETIIQNRSVLIFCPTKNWCENLAQQISITFRNLGFSNTTYGNNLREQLNGNEINEVLEQLKSCPVGLDQILQSTISFGVAYHHAGLTMDERDIIEASFKNNIVRVLIATSTLSSGVNLPARRVIIRSPLFNYKPINIMTYKQMIGRAGRMGIDSAGESILICSIKEKTIASNLLKGSFDPINSCLEGGDKLMRAILESIASEIALSKDDIELYTNCTLLFNSLMHVDELKWFADDTVKKLEEYELIRLQKVEDKISYLATPLGKACLASSMSPQDGLNLFIELQKARECFVLETDLHMIYLVTPYSICNQWGDLNWLQFLSLWENLSMAMKRVGRLVGIQESVIYSCMRNSDKMNTPSMVKKYQIYKRFYTALALQDLVNEIPLNIVADKFNCSRGMLQSLQQSAATFAGMVTAFTRQLGWKNFEILVSQFQDRLQFGIQSELLDLMKLQSLNGLRARAIYNAGIESVVQLANADVVIIENALNSSIPFQSEKTREGEHKFDADKRNNMKCIWITGKKGVSTKIAAELLISEARLYLQLELGITNFKWKTEECVNQSIEIVHSTPSKSIKSDSESLLASSDSGNITHESYIESSLLENSLINVKNKDVAESSVDNMDTVAFHQSIIDKSNSLFENNLSKSLFDDSFIIDTQLGGMLDNRISNNKSINEDSKIYNPVSLEKVFAASFDTKDSSIQINSSNVVMNNKRKHSVDIMEYNEKENLSILINQTPHKMIKIDSLSRLSISDENDQIKSDDFIHFDIKFIYNDFYSSTVVNNLNIFHCCRDRNMFKKFVNKMNEIDTFSLHLDVDKDVKKQCLIGSNLVNNKNNDSIFNKRDCSNDEEYVRGVAVSLDGNETFYIDLQSDQISDELCLNEVLLYLESLLNNVNNNVIIYNSKNAYMKLKRCCDIVLNCDWEDPLIADWLLDSECLIKPLVKMANVYCSYNLELIKSIDHINSACVMAWVSKEVMKALKKIIYDKHCHMLDTFNVEMKSLQVVALCELNGIHIDKEIAISTLNQIKSVQTALETNAFKLTGKRFKFTSSSDVAKAIGIYKGKRVSTNKKTLEKIENPLAQIVIYWRKLNTILTKNIFPLISKAVNESNDDRIYGLYWTHTSTGRITMQEPNLQSMPRSFEVPQELITRVESNCTISKTAHFCCRNIFNANLGYVLISADYCQLELRLLTHMSKDQTLQRIVKSGQDIFKAIASVWKGISEEEVDDDLRQKTKNLCYGIIYGMGIRSLAQALDMCEIEAEMFLKAFHSTYPGINKFVNKTIEDCKKMGYVETMRGRRRYLPSINSNNYSEKSHAERQAVNTAIQGSAADILKSAMILINNNIQEHYKDCNIKLVLLMHDELIYEIPMGEVDRFSEMFKRCMENTVKLSIPLPVKVKYGKSWGDMQEIYF